MHKKKDKIWFFYLWSFATNSQISMLLVQSISDSFSLVAALTSSAAISNSIWGKQEARKKVHHLQFLTYQKKKLYPSNLPDKIWPHTYDQIIYREKPMNTCFTTTIDLG